MRLFGRRSRRARQGPPAAAPAPDPGTAAPDSTDTGPQSSIEAGAELESLPLGAYVTDGRSLFRIEHAIFEGAGGDLLVELEDCRTLELILCPARALDGLRLRAVAAPPRGREAAHGARRGPHRRVASFPEAGRSR
jgi:hypothetical protein